MNMDETLREKAIRLCDELDDLIIKSSVGYARGAGHIDNTDGPWQVIAPGEEVDGWPLFEVYDWTIQVEPTRSTEVQIDGDGDSDMRLIVFMRNKLVPFMSEIEALAKGESQ